MIFTNIAYSSNKTRHGRQQLPCLGEAYDNFMNQIGDDDWACFLDHDAMFTTDVWYNQIERIINSRDDIGLLTSLTNRIGNVEQIIFDKNSDEAYNHDIIFHRKVGQNLANKHDIELIEANNLISGVVMVISKKMWKQIGRCPRPGWGVDHDIDSAVRKTGKKTYIMRGVYTYHWYKADKKGVRGYRD
tara:strand:+ start:407 stop:970 length:564 start_codon:yes stop_codon:yes gene_type:complete